MQLLSTSGQKLQLSQSAKHLGHILCCNLSDNEESDIFSIKMDLTHKAVSCMLHTFSCCDPLTKTMLFHSFCLCLYGSARWMSSSSLEVTFNNILRKIWSLPRACHTGILHQVAGLHSIFNVVVSRSSKLLLSSLKSKSPVFIDIHSELFPGLYQLGLYSVIVPSKVTLIKAVSVLDSSGT